MQRKNLRDLPERTAAMNKTGNGAEDKRLRVERAVVVEGKDDVSAVTKACDALIIPTHGFGITAETWAVLAKANEELGLIILTDPDHAGQEIRRMLTEKFPGAVQCYMAREDAVSGDDIGIENADPEDIRKAVARALELHKAVCSAADPQQSEDSSYLEVTASDLTELGLSGAEGSSERRASVCKALGIGYCNSGALLKRLRGFRIGYEELRKAADAISPEQ